VSGPDHLRYAGRPEAEQRAALTTIIRDCPALMRGFRAARALDLPDWWIVSGAIYNQVWNHLTHRPALTGVKDIDLFYFDPDTSYAAEDAVIQRAAAGFAGLPVPVEVRNQARVHLWYQAHFGVAYDPLTHAAEALENFACRTHAVGLRLRADDGFDIAAPFGLDDIFSFRVVPLTKRDNRATHAAKAARQQQIWPELTVIPWPDDA